MSLLPSRPGISLGRLGWRVSSAGRIAETYLRVSAPSNARAVAQPPDRRGKDRAVGIAVPAAPSPPRPAASTGADGARRSPPQAALPRACPETAGCGQGLQG